jgi:preprotein translocase subunit YajC
MSLISSAYAQTSAPASGSGVSQILMLVVFVAIFYFMLIRPQQKRAKELQSMLSQLATGDDVATSGGLLGRVVDISDNVVTLDLADNVRVKVQKSAVTQVLPKGTVVLPKGTTKGG